MAQAVAEMQRLEASADSLAASMQQAALASRGVNPAGYAKAARELKANSVMTRNAAQSTGLWAAEQLKLNTAADDYNKKLAARKMSLSDLRKESKIASAAFREQLALQNMVVRSAGKVGGKELFDVYTPTQLHKNLDTTAMKFGFLREQIASASHQLVNWGKNTQWAGRQLMVGLTMPVAAFGAAAGVMAYKIEDELTRIQKVIDTNAKATVGDAESMKAVERELAQVRVESLNTAQKAAREYAASGEDTLAVQADLAAVGLKGLELQKQTNEVMRIATLGELDRQTSTEMAIALQSVFRMNNKELADSFNYLNAIENATSLSTQDFATAIPIAAAPMKAWGGDIQELGILLTTMRERGIQAGKAANAIKATMQRLLRPSAQVRAEFQALTGEDIVALVEQGKSLTEVFQLIGESVDGLGNKDKQKVFAGLFGSYQVTNMMAMTEGVMELEHGIGQAAKAADIAKASTTSWAETAKMEIDRMMKSPAKAFKAQLAELQLNMAEFGKPFLVIATTILKAVNAILKAFDKMPAGIKIAAGLTLGIAALAGPVLMLIGLFANLAGNLGKFFVMLTKGAVKFELLNKESAAAQAAQKMAEAGFISTGTAVDNLAMKLGRLAEAFEVASAASASRMGVSPAPVVGPFQGPAPAPGTVVGGVISNRSGQQLLDRQGNPITTQMVDDTAKIEQNSKKIKGHWADSGKLMGAATVAMMAGQASSSEMGSNIANMAMSALMLSSVVSMFKGGFRDANGELKTARVMWTGIYGTASKFASKVKSVILFLPRLLRLISPWGLALSAAVGAFALIKDSMGQAQEDQRAINDSASTWAETLGYTEKSLGHAGQHTGKIVSDMERITELGRQFAATNPAIVQRFLSYESEADQMLFAQQQYVTMRQTGASEAEALKGIQILFASTGDSIDKVDEKMIKFQSNLAIGADKTTRSVEQLRTEFELFTADQKFWKPMDPDMGKFNWKFMFNEGKAVFDTFFADEEAAAYETGRNIGKQIDHGLSTIKNPFERNDFMKNARKQLNDQFRGVFEQINQDTMTQLANGAMKIDPKNVEQMQRVIYDATRMASGAFQEKYGVDYNSWMRLNEDSVKGYKEVNALEKGILNYLKQQLKSRSDANTLAEFMRDEQNNILGLTKKQAMEQFKQQKGAAELAGRLKGTLETGDGLLTQNEELNKKQQLRILNNIREQLGLKKTGRLLDWFGPATKRWEDGQKGVTDEANRTADALRRAKAITNEGITAAVKEGYSSFQQGIADATMSQFESNMTSAMDAIDADAERRTSRLEAQQERASKGLENRQEARRKRIEGSYDKRIDAVNKTIEAEQKAEDIRKRIFDAEMQRIDRLNESANRNIDFNVALNAGNLDEAAKIRNDMEAAATGWALADAGDKAERKAEKSQDKLAKRVDRINEEKDARLEALSKVEEREKEAMSRTQEARKKHLEAELAMEKKNAEARWETRQKYLEESLDDFTGYISTSEKDMKEHIKKWNAEHKGMSLVTEGQFKITADNINKYIGESVTKAANEMVNESDWATNGWDIAKKMIDGAFGMTPTQFRKFISTGEPPAGWGEKPAKAPNAGKAPAAPEGTRGGHKGGVQEARHAGGEIGTGGGSRTGYARTMGQHRNEVNVLAERGEFMVNKHAAQKHRPLLEQINSNKNSRLNKGTGIGGGGTSMGFATIFGAMMSAALKTSINNGIIKAGSAAQARQAAASPYASSYGAARAGTYGDSAFTDEQLKNAATIAGVGKTLGASSRDIQIALMTAMQESTLRNLDWGDRDSVGLFQQRDAWGSFADRTNPAKAARMFFLGGAAGQRGLFDFPERNSMSLAQAAQAVQVSAYPDAYAKWADEAAAIMKAMTRAPAGTNAAGYTPGEGGWHKPSIPGKGWANTHDYGNGIGSPLFAASDGVIVDSRAITSGGSPGNGRYATPYRSYGETIAMRTASGDILRYAHLNPGERYVSAGQKVKGGALIGRSGMTGNATGPHTHFDVNGNYNASGWMAAKGISLSKGAANVRWDNTLANLHKGEAVLTEDLNKKFHQGVERFANGGETVYNLNMNFGSVSNKDEIAQHVINTIKRAEARKPKPRGAR